MITALLIGSAPAASVAPTSCVVSQTDVLQRSQPALDAGTQLQQARQRVQAEYDAASREIESDARMLSSLKSSLPATVAQKRVEDIANRRIALQRKTEAVNRGLSELNETLSRRVMQQASSIIRDIAQMRGCSMVFARETTLQVIDPSSDLTVAVLEKLGLKPQQSNAPR